MWCGSARDSGIPRPRWKRLLIGGSRRTTTLRMTTPTTRCILWTTGARPKCSIPRVKKEVPAKEMFDSTVSILFQAMRMEGSTVPGSQFSTTGVRFDEGRNFGDIAGRPDGKAYKNVPNKPDRGGLGSSFQTKVDGNLLDADSLGYAGLTTENTYSETTGPPQVMAFPWLPFFSNCRGFDSQIAYSKLLETHEDCRLSKHEDTRFIYDFDPLEQFLTKGMWESDAIADVHVTPRRRCGGRRARRKF